MINTLYRDEILEHYKNPQHFGKLHSYSISSKQLNSLCGDEIEIFIQLDSTKQANKKIKDIGFLGKGCAISIASASILTDFVKNKSRNQLTKFSEDDMLSLLGIEVSETRKKCALLAHAVFKDCLNQI